MTEELKEIVKEDKGVKPTWAIWVLGIFALLAAGLLAYTHFVYYPEQLSGAQNNTNITAAYQYGIITTINAIVNKTNDCQVVTLQTAQYNRTIADIECFAKMLKEKNISLG